MRTVSAAPLAAPRRGPPPVRRDPAPTRWAYRMQRVMLTPYLRALLRVGLPTFVVLAFVGIY
ncbi:MAG: cell division protein FtsQ, partial [Tabrizicola sp.]